MKAYSLFWNYSLGNQILALVQRISETNGKSVVSGRRLTGFLAGLRRRIRILCQPRSENCPGLPIFFGEAGTDLRASRCTTRAHKHVTQQFSSRSAKARTSRG